MRPRSTLLGKVRQRGLDFDRILGDQPIIAEDHLPGVVFVSSSSLFRRTLAKGASRAQDSATNARWGITCKNLRSTPPFGEWLRQQRSGIG